MVAVSWVDVFGAFVTLVALAVMAYAAAEAVREVRAQDASDREWNARQALRRISAMEHELGLTPCVLWRTGCWEAECRQARAEREQWESRVMRGEAP